MTASIQRAQRRVDRSYARMLHAQGKHWRHAWGSGFVAAVSARNAIRSVADVRAIERERGLA